MTVTLARQQPYRMTAAQWRSSSPVLLTGEVGYETDTGYTKRGDGTTPWNSLPYEANLPAVQAISTAVTAGRRAYHIDPNSGSDSNPGTTPGLAWATIGHAQSVVDGTAAVFYLYPGVHPVTSPVLLKSRQDWIGVGGRSGVGSPSSGASGVIIQAAAGFTGTAVLDHTGTAVGDSWHWASIENLAIDANKAAGVVTSGIHIFEAGEECTIRRVAVWNAKKSGYLFTGTHAVLHLDNSSAWGCEDYGYKFTADTNGSLTGNGGSARLIGPSGDKNLPGFYYCNGSHALTIVGFKHEGHSASGMATFTWAGSSIGGGRGRLALIGGRADPAAVGGIADGSFVRITETARPSITLLEAHLPHYTYIIEDLVISRTVLPSSSNAYGFIQWAQDGGEGIVLDAPYLQLGAAATINSGGIRLTNTATPPTPASGTVALYVESGSLKVKGSNGTVTVLGAA